MATPKPRLYLPSGTPESGNPPTRNHIATPETTKTIPSAPTAARRLALPAGPVAVKFPSLPATINLTPQITQTARLYPSFASEVIHIPPPPILLPPVSGPLPRLEEKLRKIVGKLDGRKRRKELRENPPMEDWWVAYVVTKERKRRKKLEKIRDLAKKRKEEERRKREREIEDDDVDGSGKMMIKCDAGEFDILDVPIEATDSAEKQAGMISSSPGSKITMPPLALPLERKMNGPININSKRQLAISITPITIDKPSNPPINHHYINNPSNLTHGPNFTNLPFRTMSTPVNPHVKIYLDNLPEEQYRPCYPVDGANCDPLPSQAYARGQLSPDLVEQWLRLPQYWQIPAKPRSASPSSQPQYYRIDTLPYGNNPPPRSVPEMATSRQSTPSWEKFYEGWSLWNPNRNTAVNQTGLSYQQDNQYLGTAPANQVGGHQYDTETVAKHENGVHHLHHDPSKGGVNAAPADQSTTTHTPSFHLQDDFSFSDFLQSDGIVVDSFNIFKHHQALLHPTPEPIISNMTTDTVSVSATDTLPSSPLSEYYDAIENTPNSTPPLSPTPPGDKATSSPTSTSSTTSTDSLYASLARLPPIPPPSSAALQHSSLTLQRSSSTLQLSSSPPFLPSPTPPPQTSSPQPLHHQPPIPTATYCTRDPIYNTFLLPPPRSGDTFYSPTRASITNLLLTFPSTTASSISPPIKKPDETDPPCVATILYFPCGHEETLWFYKCPRQWWFALPHDARRNLGVLKSEGWIEVDSTSEGEGDEEGQRGKKKGVETCCDPTLEHWAVKYPGFCAVCCPDEREVLLAHARQWGLEESVEELVQMGKIMGEEELEIEELVSEEMQLEMEEKMQDEEMWQKLCENIEYHAEMIRNGQNNWV